MLDTETKKALRDVDSIEALLQLLSGIDLAGIYQRDVDSISRAHRRLIGLPDSKIAYLGNHTIEPLNRFVEVACLLQGISITGYIGEYDQYFQEILDRNSGCHAFQPDVIFLDLSLRSLSPKIYHELLSLTGEQRQEEMTRVLGLVSDWVELAKNQTDAILIISNYPRPARTQAGIADIKIRLGEAEFYHILNLELQRTFIDEPRVNIFDMDHVLSCVGKLNTLDPRMYYLAKIEWTEQALLAIAGEILRFITAILGRTKKCLVLDLDNTLWGGIVGEDGINGLTIGEGSPEGEAFLDFQRYIRALKERGVILAICSKNNIQDAVSVFLDRDEMLLKIDDFSVTKINWEHKHINLQNIATELNIGADSLVFVDDNPVECELVRQMLPEVETVKLARDPSMYVSQLKGLTLFEKVEITDEDRQKTVQYAQNTRRDALKSKINDINTFLESLGTEITISVPTEKHKVRTHQLFTKTNQFNLTSSRYSLSDIQRFFEDAEWDINITHVKDNFGDLGIVGLYLVNKKDTIARIDSFILSCRAMGRGIETAMMNKIKDDYLVNGDYKQLSAAYLPTDKNKPAAEFYETEGFDIVSEESSGEKKYIVNKRNVKINDCTGIVIRSV